MYTVNMQKPIFETQETEPKHYYVHKDIVLITEYVSIGQEEPLEIIQCCVDVSRDGKKGSVISTR